jgi:hypothetical protein
MQCNEWPGLPCLHLTALYAKFAHGAFPAALIAKRWIPDICEEDVPDVHWLSLEESDDAHRIARRGEMDERDEGGEGRDDDSHNGLQQASNDEGALAVAPTRETPRARYLHLFHLGKQIAQKGSIARDRYENN